MKIIIKPPGGLNKIINALKRKREAVQPNRATYGKSVAALLSFVKKDINAKGALHKRFSWPELAESTKRAKKRRGQSPNAMLIGKTGNLRRKWDQRFSDSGGKLTSLQDYAIHHEKETSRIPQRKILPDKAQAEEIVFPIFKAHVRIGVKA